MKSRKQETIIKPQKDFANIYYSRLSHETQITITGTEPLALLDYDKEILAKDRAFSSYLYELALSISPSQIIRSPLPRRYRTTTKRRAHSSKGKILLLCDESASAHVDSLLEPEFHSKIYKELSHILNSNAGKNIAHALNFVIIRGNYEKCSVIFNIRQVNSYLIDSCKKMGEHLKELFAEIDGAFIYFDREGSKYYLNTSGEADGPRLKRLFGNKNLSAKINDIIYTYPPDSFSQVNLSICSDMLNTAKNMIGCGSRLLDLYCGYGFFSCFLAGNFDEVIGIDYTESSINAARENIKRLKLRSRYEFIAKKIENKSIKSILPAIGSGECVILDPPKNGTAPGVVEYIASRRPEKVLHIFCGLETIPYELQRWKSGGYLPEVCIPLDMFPGTPELEVMILLKHQSLKTKVSSKSGR